MGSLNSQPFSVHAAIMLWLIFNPFFYQWKPINYLTQALLISSGAEFSTLLQNAAIKNLDDAAISTGITLQFQKRKPMSLVPPSPLILPYHNGPVLSGPSPINVYLIFYGTFSQSQKQIIRSFIHSFNGPKDNAIPTISSWWSLTNAYTDFSGASVSQNVTIGGETSHNAESFGKELSNNDIQKIVLNSMKLYPQVNPNSIFLVLTAADVSVHGFCQDLCGQHLYTFPSQTNAHQLIPFAWVGNSASQCPGFCAWPFAKPQFGPNTPPLLPPNGDVGIDGMIISIAKILVGTATDPYGTAYYQGDASAGLEAAGACTGTFGDGAYPGDPGMLLKNNKTGASFNVYGFLNRQFLVPWIWNPVALACAGQA
ncbi:hypothetical protein O6H91_Y384200 [Diphasiastrum complanatum]|nr:hypothetical protein O6H91_Y384200 [Diphasiastrum complanatum]